MDNVLAFRLANSFVESFWTAITLRAWRSHIQFLRGYQIVSEEFLYDNACPATAI